MPDCSDCRHLHTLIDDEARDCGDCRYDNREMDVEPCRSCDARGSQWEPVEPPAQGPEWCGDGVPLTGSGQPAFVSSGGGGYVGFPDARPEPLGVKLDDEKTRWDLVPWPALELVAQALTLGAAKYPEPENWRRVPNARRRYFAAAIRHAVAWLRGEKTDPESGLPHLAHLACNALFLLSFDLDDAPPPALEEP